MTASTGKIRTIEDSPPSVSGFVQDGGSRSEFRSDGRRYLEELDGWLSRANPYLGGHHVVRQYTRAHDELLEAAYRFTAQKWESENNGRPPRISLMGLGGYGRRELCMGSDIDIMLLMHEMDSASRDFVKELYMLLIDLRLKLGHSTRTIDDAVDRLGQDLDSSTSMTEARLIAGSKSLSGRFVETISRQIRGKYRRWFLRNIHEGWIACRKQFANTVYLLEPNLKSSAGGLRDVHTVRWELFANTDSSELKNLKTLAGFYEDELRRYRDAIAMILTVRNEIHLLSDGKNDQLYYFHQPDVARRLGYQEQEHRQAEEVFMAAYYMNALMVARYSERAINIITLRGKSVMQGLRKKLLSRKLDKYVSINGNVISVDPAHPDYFTDRSDRIMLIFERSIRWGCRVGNRTRDWIARAARRLPDTFAEDTKNHRIFLNIIGHNHHVEQTLADMHASEVLSRLIPEFAHLHCMVRIDHYHQFTVDHHTLRAIEMAERLLADPGESSTLPGRIARDIERWDLLNMALLMHDIGKGLGSGHALRGGKIASRVCERFGMPPEDVEMVRFLVLSHLKLNHAATRRDLSDPVVARQLADEIGSMERLKMLYVHTVCDLKAVSSEVWTDWTASLLAACYKVTARVLTGTEMHKSLDSPDRKALSPGLLRETERLYGREWGKIPIKKLADKIELFLQHASERYLHMTRAEVMAHHFQLKQWLDEENLVAWKILPSKGSGLNQLVVCAADTIGLFSHICGAFTAKGINIRSARISSTTDGYALDSFDVTDVGNRPLPVEYRIERLRRDLNEVLHDRKTIGELMVEHRVRARRRTRIEAPHPNSVSFDNTSSQECTIIEVRTSDMPGVLFAITRALAECQLDIQRALIRAEAYGVVDVFYVTDLEYNKIHDESRCRKIEASILGALGQCADNATTLGVKQLKG
jgi:[protein-PII] uridylyltransferase